MRQTSRNSSWPLSSDLPWDKAGSNAEAQPPQQGQDEFAGVDDHTLDAEEALKTGPEEKIQDKALEVPSTKQLKDEASLLLNTLIKAVYEAR